MALRLAVAAAIALVPAGGASSLGEIEHLRTGAKVVALTFDGGDNGVGAPLILRVLTRRKVPATFFVSGKWIRRYPRLARRIGKRYEVGNHTWSHPDLTRLSSREVRSEVVRGGWWVRAATGHRAQPLFRFPFGARDSRTLAIVRSLGYVSVRWSIDTWGWMGPSHGQSVSTVVQRFSSQLRPGAIVLMHVGVARDGSLLDAHALPEVIKVARRRGYRFVFLRPWLRRR